MNNLKQQFTWAIVTRAGKLALFSGQCPIYWRRYVAQAECTRHNRGARDAHAFHVEKVTVLPVFRA